jgi:hypothetical protein
LQRSKQHYISATTSFKVGKSRSLKTGRADGSRKLGNTPDYGLEDKLTHDSQLKYCTPSGDLLGGDRSRVLSSFRWRSDDLHLLPVVGKFSSAIQTRNVRSRQHRRLRSARISPKGYGETITGMPATKYSIEQSCHHGAPSTDSVLGVSWSRLQDLAVSLPLIP